ncbi:MAG: hypothetical protein NVS4B6_16600 [Mycobacterium sp.]
MGLNSDEAARRAVIDDAVGYYLEMSLASRDAIGQANGIIMERFAVDDIRAFAMLTRLSQDSNTKLLNVAKSVIATRNKG